MVVIATAGPNININKLLYFQLKLLFYFFDLWFKSSESNLVHTVTLIEIQKSELFFIYNFLSTVASCIRHSITMRIWERGSHTGHTFFNFESSWFERRQFQGFEEEKHLQCSRRAKSVSVSCPHTLYGWKNMLFFHWPRSEMRWDFGFFSEQQRHRQWASA